MPDDTAVPASLAYRKARPAIWAGLVPVKYTRLLEHIRGPRVLEIGAAEGVLSLLLSREQRVDQAVAVELRIDRHEEGLRLRQHWLAEHGFDVTRCLMVCADIRERLDLLEGVDTLVAVRAIYYLRDDAPKVLEAAAEAEVPRVVLCGNRGRQEVYRAQPTSELGRFNRYAAVDGMTALLEGAGYRIETIVDEGDPIVVGRDPDLA